jgi:hypothetical protein
MIDGVTGPVDAFANTAVNMVGSSTETSTSALTDTTTAPMTSSFTVTSDVLTMSTSGGHGHPVQVGAVRSLINIPVETTAATNSTNQVFVSPVISDTVAKPTQNQGYVTSAPRPAASFDQFRLTPSYIISAATTKNPLDGERRISSAEENEIRKPFVSRAAFSGPPVRFDVPPPAETETSILLYALNVDAPEHHRFYLEDIQAAAAPENPIDDAQADFKLFPSYLELGAGLATVLMAAYLSRSDEDSRNQQQPSLPFSSLPNP